MNINNILLENKFEVIYAKVSSNPIISLQLYIKIGSAWEKSSEAGYSHFLEHLVFKSTKNYPENSIMDRVTFLGGQINAYTEFDSTCFYLTLPSKFISDGIEILSDIVQFADFSEEDFSFEKKVVFEELQQYENEPEENFIETIAYHYLEKNPYRHPIIGNRKTIQNAKKNDLEKFYRTYYSPSNAFLVVSGDFELENVKRLCQEYFSKWENSSIPTVNIDDTFIKKFYPYHFIKKNLKNDFIAFAIPDLAETHHDSIALTFAIKQFAAGKQARLYKRLFHEEKLIDTIKINSICGRLNGLSIILIFTKARADKQKIVDIVMQEWNHYLQFGITTNEIQAQKRESLYQYRYSFEFVESLASSLGNETLIGNYKSYLEHPKKLESITREHVNSTIHKYLSLDNIQLFHCGINPLEIKDLTHYKIDKKNKEKTEFKSFVERKLSNGLQVILKKVVGKPTIGISLTFHISNLQEEKKYRGLNLLTSSLLLYGNQKRDYDQFQQYCRNHGIHCGVAPRTETTSIRMKCFKEYLQEAIELLSDIIEKPLFPETHLQNIKATISSNLERIQDYPQVYSNQLWLKMLFGKDSNLTYREGTKSTLSNLSRRKVTQWYKQNFHLSNATLAIVGDFDFDQVFEQLERHLSDKKIKFQSDVLPLHISKPTSKFRTHKKDNPQAYIHFGGFACSNKDVMKSTSFHVLAQILGGDTNSHLFQELREKSGLAYMVDFELRTMQHIGEFHAFTIVDKKNEKPAIEIIRNVLEKSRMGKISDIDLTKTINYIRGNRLIDEESVLSQASIISALEVMGFGYKHYQTRDERLQKVTLDSIKKIAEEYFHEENYFIHVLS